MADPILIKKTVVLVKAEVTVGTDSVPTGAANAVQVDQVMISPLEAKTVDRKPIRAFFGGAEKTTASQHYKLEIEVPLSGSGAAGVVPQYDALMKICGASSTVVATTSVTYAPVSSSLTTASIYVNVDGTNHILRSARGTWAMTTNAEGLPALKFTIWGLWTPLAATALPAATYAGFVRPVPVNAANTTLTLHAIPLVASAFSMNCGAAVSYKNRIGGERVQMTDRASDFAVTFESVALATKDWIGATRTNNIGALALVHGLTAGNIITINSATAQLWTAKYGEDEGAQMTDITGGLNPSTSGNDEWSIVLT